MAPARQFQLADIDRGRDLLTGAEWQGPACSRTFTTFTLSNRRQEPAGTMDQQEPEKPETSRDQVP